LGSLDGQQDTESTPNSVTGFFPLTRQMRYFTISPSHL
jgi:hypothetical protein